MTTNVRLALLLFLLAPAAPAGAQVVLPSNRSPGGWQPGVPAVIYTAPPSPPPGAAAPPQSGATPSAPAAPAAPAAPGWPAPPGPGVPVPYASGWVASPSDVTLRAGVEYLLWWTKGDPVPPLATTSPAGTPRDTAGILGQDSTSVLFGGSGVDSGLQQGARFTIAIGNTDGCPCGLEADFFFLGGHVTHFQADSDGSTILARPFFDPTTNANSAQLVAFPGSQSGSVSASTLSQLLGAGVRIRERLLSGGPVTLDFLGGYRYLHLADRLNVNDNSTVTNPNGLTDANGTVTSRFDRFEATNDFHGADLGFVTAFNQGPLSVEVLTKVAFGVTHRFVDISGSTTTTQPGSAPVTSLGGLLALPSNSMTLGTSTFAVVPEFGLKLGYQVRDNIRLTAGYTYFYWSHVSRAGDQVDFTVNTTQQLNGTLTGANRPQFVIHDTTFWAQGISLGVEFVY